MEQNEQVCLQIRNLSKQFTIYNTGKTIYACQHVSLTLNQGEFIGITGKSGSGKSTILKGIYRTNLPQTGEIWYASEKYGWIDLCQATERQILYLRRYEIGYVSQFLQLMPRTTARQIVENAILEMGGNKETAVRESEAILRHFELDESLWDTYPNTFSGGEKLRLNIASAMVKHPRLLLLDEPTASLDQHSKLKVRDLIKQLKKEGTTMLGIFHDLEFMENLCDRRYNMQLGAMDE